VVRVNRARPLVGIEREAGGTGRTTEFDLVPVIDFLLRPVVPGVIAVALVVIGVWLCVSAPGSGASTGALLGASLLGGAVVTLAVAWLGWSRDAAEAARAERERKLKEKRDRFYALGLSPDLRGITLPSGADLSGFKIPRRDFSGATLEGVIFDRADLTHCTLRANLRNASMRSAVLYKVDFRNAVLQRAHLEDAWLMSANLDDADLSAAHLDNARLQDASFKGTKLFRTSFSGAEITGLDFSEAKYLEEAILQGARVTISDKGEKVDTVVKFPVGFNWREKGLDVLKLYRNGEEQGKTSTAQPQ
jgi:hypothetical protein